jgi:hypothetical protein
MERKPMSVTQEVWFARCFPLGSMRAGMAPVHWKGWLVVAGFAAGLGASGAFGAWLASIGLAVKGIAAFGIGAFGSALGLIRATHKKGDHINCVADYEKGKLRV